MKTLGVIPARYASSRFPGKPLAIIHGKSMIQRVYEQAQSATTLERVVVATDDDRIEEAVQSFGGEVVMTDPNHPSGTDRCHEALQQCGEYEVVVNIQGDEPFIDPHNIDLLVGCFADASTQIATLIKKVSDGSVLCNPNKMKVVITKNMEAMYFSRTAIPYHRGEEEDWLKAHTYYSHIGIYAYRASTLTAITKLPPSSLENTEKLEQLRWLENGYRINVALTETEAESIDTPEDLARVLEQHR